MFKILALCGAIAGGATYGLYTHTDLFKCHGGCPLAGTKVSSDSAVVPPCCQRVDDCCESGDICCELGTAVSAGLTGSNTDTCCSLTRVSAAKKSAPCCAVACAACGTSCDGCPICVADCGDCCGVTAKAASAVLNGATQQK